MTNRPISANHDPDPFQREADSLRQQFYELQQSASDEVLELKAEISRLRADRITPEEAEALVQWVNAALERTGWKLTIEQRAIDRLRRLSSESKTNEH